MTKGATRWREGKRAGAVLHVAFELDDSLLEPEPFVALPDPVAEPLGFAARPFSQPRPVGGRCAVQAKAANLKRDQLELNERSGFHVQRRKIHQHQVSPVLRVAADPLVVVQELATTVENEVAVVDRWRASSNRSPPPEA